MNRQRILALAQRAAREAQELFLAALAFVFVVVARLVPERAMVRAGGFLARHVGMWIPRRRQIGLRNLALAFPEKTEEERRKILAQSWDNMGRAAVEYLFIDRIWDFDSAAAKPGRIEIEGLERFVRLATDDKPAIVLSAHLANWELPMVAASRHGLDAAALFVSPRNRWIGRLVAARRRPVMGELIASGPGALHRLAGVLEAGRHLGLLVDQYHRKGPKITMFGHPTAANPIFARLARQFECPVHMVRVVRLPGDRFRIELSEELDLPRDASGRIDVAAATQTVAVIIEGWVREHPGQWLWVHRRWR
ncbi:MAG: lipid A biosynthesis lauroyl acyltransferase [Roseiarcus sp.]|jgi:KDO2-lipid IV(A) lauroyltransferase